MIHNLDEETPEYFEFVLGGHQCKMRYPTTEEVEAIEKEPDDNKTADMVYGLITLPEGAPSFRDIIGKANVLAAQKFLKMVREEFGGVV